MTLYLKNIFSDHVKANQLSAIIRFGVALIISIILVRSHLSDSEVGTLEYGILLAYSFSFFWGFAYASGILSKIVKYDDTQFTKILQDVFLQLIIVAALTSTLLFSSLSVLQSYKVFEITSITHFQIAIYCFFLIVGIIPEVYFLLYKEAKSLIYYSLFFNVLLLFGIFFLLLYGYSINQIFYLYIAMQIGRFSLGVYLVRPTFRWNFEIQKSWFLYIIPLVVHFILGSSMDYIDGHLVAQFFDEEQFLFYRYGARELPFSLLFINALSTAFIPLISSNINQLSDLRRRVGRLMHFLFPISVVFLFISPGLFQFIYGDQFIVSAWVFNVYILILSSRILTPQLVLYAKNDNKMLMIFSGLELIINVVLSVILMRFYGVIGIALATVLAFAMNKIMCIIYCKKRFGISLNQYINPKIYGGYMMVLIVSFLISMYIFHG